MNNKTRNPLEDYQTALKEFEESVDHGEKLYARMDELKDESARAKQQLTALEPRRKKALAEFTKTGNSKNLDQVKGEISQIEQRITNLGNAVECAKGFLDDLKPDLEKAEAALRSAAIGYWADVERQALNEITNLTPVFARAHHAWQSTGRHLSFHDYWERRVPAETKLFVAVQETNVAETEVPVRPPEAPYHLLTGQERTNLKRHGSIHPKSPVKGPQLPTITDEFGRPSQGVPRGPVLKRDRDGNPVPA
ncbi:MAG: hypothetical protein ACE5FN_09800 [Leptospirillia bacterium]